MIFSQRHLKKKVFRKSVLYLCMYVLHDSRKERKFEMNNQAINHWETMYRTKDCIVWKN